MTIIFIQRTPDGGYAITEAEAEQAGFGKLVGASTEQDVTRELKNFGFDDKAIEGALQQLRTDRQVMIPKPEKSK